MRTKILYGLRNSFTKRVITQMATKRLYRMRHRDNWTCYHLPEEVIYTFADYCNAVAGKKLAKKKAGCS